MLFASLVLRALWISLVLGWAFISYGARRLGRWRVTPEARERLRGRVMATTFERLGATFIKFGQILSTRPDLLGPGYIDALSKLQDQVAPVKTKVILAALERWLPEPALERLIHIEPTPVAAASVAQVHRATLDTGEAVALKIQRPGVHRLIHGDLSILRFWARVVNLIPSMRPLSLPGSVERFGISLAGQLDFRLEAANNRRFSEIFSDLDGLDVPRLFDELCGERVLAMEFIEGVRGSEPERVGGDRVQLAELGTRAVLRMVFEVGFVHADLHPGNIILTDEGRVVFIDLGMVAEIPPELKRPWVTTFMALGQRDGAEVARLLYIYSPKVSDLDYPTYEAELVAHFDQFHGKPIGQIEISEVVGGVMSILRKYRVTIDPSFTVVNIAILVAEGLAKQLDPGLDFVSMALPVLFSAVRDLPPGIAPRRRVPGHASAAAERRA